MWVRGQWRLLKGVTFESLGYGFLFAFHSNYGCICSHLWDIQCQRVCVCVCGVLSRYSCLRWWATVCRGRSVVRGVFIYTQLYTVYKQSITIANISAVLRLLCRVAVSLMVVSSLVTGAADPVSASCPSSPTSRCRHLTTHLRQIYNIC